MRPGPGRYEHKGMPHGPSWGFGTESKRLRECEDTPGCNHYHLRSTIADVPSYVLSKQN